MLKAVLIVAALAGSSEHKPSERWSTSNLCLSLPPDVQSSYSHSAPPPPRSFRASHSAAQGVFLRCYPAWSDVDLAPTRRVLPLSLSHLRGRQSRGPFRGQDPHDKPAIAPVSHSDRPAAPSIRVAGTNNNTCRHQLLPPVLTAPGLAPSMPHTTSRRRRPPIEPARAIPHHRG